ncbi:Severe Depolymerization of Actin [Dimargaris verticillata]|uniref:Protein SDA1 n=1 Tax=Dimargaris verticillata TaxID=2761393 RepID=A0A9W8B645_9FUNG|nr:Severe Depolymerization of Actin [Dimargaris verticillata]
MVRKQRAALLPINLPQLQNLIKRDPLSYKEEFSQQWKHYESTLVLLRLKPEEDSKKFTELVQFLAQVCQCYPTDCAQFPDQLIELLQTQYSVLHPDLRRSIVQSLILMRNKGILDSTKTLPLFFTLFRCHDKGLRELLYRHIVGDIRTANAQHKNNRLNKSLQSFMYTMLLSATNASSTHASAPAKSANSGDNAIAAKKSVDVCIELYRKHIWDDAKTANIIAEACFSPVTKIMVAAVQFFLGNDDNLDDGEDGSDSEAEQEPLPNIRKMQHSAKVGKKKKSKARLYDKALARVRKGNSANGKAGVCNFSAIHLLHDPQSFTERLYSRLHKPGSEKHSTVDRFEVRLMVMKLIARLIGAHQLQMLSFYSFLLRYLQPHQADVTQVLALLAQASHPMVPPDAIEPALMAIANRFVTDHCSPEVMAAGINSIRAVTARCPLAMPSALLEDLTQFKSHRNKGVMMAARSLITLYREVNPEMLRRKDRGKAATLALIAKAKVVPQYGEVSVNDGIEGADLLLEATQPRGTQHQTEGDDDSDDGWEEMSNQSDDSGGWINVSHSEGEVDEDAANANAEWETDSDGSGAESSSDELEASGDEGEDTTCTQAMQVEESEDDDGQEADPDSASKTDTADKPAVSAVPLELTKILSPQDFQRIEALKAEYQVMSAQQGPIKARDTLKRKLAVEAARGQAINVEQGDLEQVITEADILGEYRKKQRSTYDDRLNSIKAGRDDRKNFGPKRSRTNESSSSTHIQSSRNKAYAMVMQKRALSKRNTSLREKSRQLRGNQKKGQRKGRK